MRETIKRLAATGCFLLASLNALALDTSVIVTGTVGCEQCTDWKISGVCYWLMCTNFGCNVETSARVSHYIPDLVIASFNGDSPLRELASYSAPTDGVLTSEPSHNDSAANFKNIEVIGNPATLVYQQIWNTTGMMCESQATAFMPYYLSSFSESLPGINWNSNLAEQALAVVHLNDRVGILGNLYPRCGWTVQPDDVGAAALTTVRAAHVVTRQTQPHVYVPVNDQCKQSPCWPPGELEVGDTDTGKFQMLWPETQDSATALTPGFGDRNWSRGKYNLEQQYAWAFWRPYSCCKPKGLFLYATILD